MAVQQLSGMPFNFFQGSTVSYLVSRPEYAGLVLEVALAGPVGGATTKKEFPDSTGHGDFNVLFTNVDTQAMTPGTYFWSHKILGPDTAGVHDSTVIGEDAVTVLINLSTTTAGQAQTVAERMLAICIDQMLALEAKGLESYGVEGISGKRKDMNQLMHRYAMWEQKVEQERGGGFPGALVRFTREGGAR